MTRESPPWVRQGVLWVSIIQLRRCLDKENLAKILTLTSEVRFSDKTLFFNRSLVHSSARDQFRNYDQFGLISGDTLLWVQNLPYFYKICWVFQKFLDSVSTIDAYFWNIWYSFWGPNSKRNTTRRGSRHRRGSLPRRGSLHTRGSLHEHLGTRAPGISGHIVFLRGRKLRGICASGGSMSGVCSSVWGLFLTHNLTMRPAPLSELDTTVSTGEHSSASASEQWGELPFFFVL